MAIPGGLHLIFMPAADTAVLLATIKNDRPRSSCVVANRRQCLTFSKYFGFMCCHIYSYSTMRGTINEICAPDIYGPSCTRCMVYLAEVLMMRARSCMLPVWVFSNRSATSGTSMMVCVISLSHYALSFVASSQCQAIVNLSLHRPGADAVGDRGLQPGQCRRPGR